MRAARRLKWRHAQHQPQRLAPVRSAHDGLDGQGPLGVGAARFEAYCYLTGCTFVALPPRLRRLVIERFLLPVEQEMSTRIELEAL